MSYDVFADPRLPEGGEPPFQVCAARGAGGPLIVRIIGGLDMWTAPLFDADVATMSASASASGVRTVEIDLTDLTFLDTAGLDALHAAVAGLEAGGAQVTVGGARREVRRLLRFAAEHCWLADGPLLAAGICG